MSPRVSVSAPAPRVSITAIGGYPLSLILTYILCVPGGVWSGRDASQELHTLLPPIDWKGGYGGGVEWFVSDGSMFDFRLSCCIWQTTGPLVLLLFQHLSRKGKNRKVKSTYKGLGHCRYCLGIQYDTTVKGRKKKNSHLAPDVIELSR